MGTDARGRGHQAPGTPAGGEYSTAPHAEVGTSLGRQYAGDTPRQVDGLLADLDAQHAKVQRIVASEVQAARSYLGHRQQGSRATAHDGWPTSSQGALAELETGLSHDTLPAHVTSRARELLTKVLELRAQSEDLEGQMHDLEDEHDARPWSRFFVVTSSAGGHIHSTRSCHTCRPTTRFGWLPQLSGKSEPDAVADQGAILCTECYPSAPAEWTRGKVDSDTCPGSGQQHSGAVKRYGMTTYGACPVCGQDKPVGFGGVRKHKAPKGSA